MSRRGRNTNTSSDDGAYQGMTFFGRYRPAGKRDEPKNEYGHLRVFLRIPKNLPSAPRGDDGANATRRRQRAALYGKREAV